MPEYVIAVGGAFAVGLILGWLVTKGGGSQKSAPTPQRASAPPAAATGPQNGMADERRAANSDLASLRRRLASVEAALREIRRSA